MRNYLNLMKQVLTTGVDRNDRTGVGTLALFNTHLNYDLRDGFPLVTTKKLFMKSVVAELICFIKGYDDVRSFQEAGTNIWNANVSADYWQGNPSCKGEFDMGRIYGVQWRRWRKPDGTEMDQLQEVVSRIKNDPHDRRLCVTAWNPGELNEMCLPPCHLYYQFFADGDYLDIFVVMRSVDTFLGMPFDIASYALLLEIVARDTGLTARKLGFTFGDTHIYKNHLDAVKEQLDREPMARPWLILDESVKGINDFNSIDQVKIGGYEHHPSIKAEMAV